MSLHIDFEQYFLPNGMRLILHRDTSTPLVAVNLWYNVGSRHEVPGKTGFAHLFEHLMFQGSRNVPTNGHFQFVEQIGGVVNGSTSFDQTNYYEALPSDYLELGLWLESDRMGFLTDTIDQEKLDNQRDVVKNERRQTVDNQPYGKWFETMLAMMFPAEFPYHWPVIGYMDDLDRATLDDVHSFFHKYYAPQNASLVIAGDFDHTEARKLVDKYFAGLPSGDPVAQPRFSSDFFRKGEKREVIRDKVQLPRVFIAYHVPGRRDSAFARGDVLSDIFSVGRSSRLYQSLVYEQELAQDASAVVLPGLEAGVLFFDATARPGVSAGQLEEGLNREIERLLTDGITESEFTRILNQFEATKLSGLETMMNRADGLNYFAVHFNDPGRINTDIDKYRKLKSGQIIEFAREYVRPENRVVLHYLPEAD